MSVCVCEWGGREKERAFLRQSHVCWDPGMPLNWLYIWGWPWPSDPLHCLSVRITGKSRRACLDYINKLSNIECFCFAKINFKVFCSSQHLHLSLNRWILVYFWFFIGVLGCFKAISLGLMKLATTEISNFFYIPCKNVFARYYLSSCLLGICEFDGRNFRQVCLRSVVTPAHHSDCHLSQFSLLLCRPDLPETQRSSCFCLSGA